MILPIIGNCLLFYIAPKSIEVAIAKADPIIYPEPQARENLKYTTNPQELIIGGLTNAGTLVYSLSEDGVYTESIPTGIDSGTYTIWYKVIGDANYNDIAPQSIEVTIAFNDLDNSNDPSDPDNPDDTTNPDNNGSSDSDNSNNADDNQSSNDIIDNPQESTITSDSTQGM